MTPANPPVWLSLATLAFHLGVFLLLLAPLLLRVTVGPRPPLAELLRGQTSPLWQRHHLLLMSLASPPGFLLFMLLESLLPAPGGGFTAVLLLLQAWRERFRSGMVEAEPEAQADSRAEPPAA